MQLDDALAGDVSTSAQIHYLAQSGIDIKKLAAQMPRYGTFQSNLTSAFHLASQVEIQ